MGAETLYASAGIREQPFSSGCTEVEVSLDKYLSFFLAPLQGFEP